MSFDIILVANSPGELSALVKPMAEELAKDKNYRIILVLTPCQYASGKELEYAKTLPGISEIITADEYKKWALLNQKPEQIEFSNKGAVLFLGGDLFHAVIIARKLKYPACAYVEDRVAWAGFYQRFFVPDETAKAKLKKFGDKIMVVGNLMVDSVSKLPKWSPEPNVITFLPGSRAWQIKHMIPIYDKIISNLKTHPDFIGTKLKIQLVSSPFESAPSLPGAGIIKFEEVYNSELVITIPGTNTARLAAMGIPMLVVFPLDNPEVIPLEGMAHYICNIPYLGPKLKRFLADSMNKSTPFFALPNIKAGKEIVPEFRGVINPKEVAEKIIGLLNDPPARQGMSQELIKAMSPPGAAEKIKKEIELVL